MLLGFAVGVLQLRSSAGGVLSVYGSDFTPLAGSGAASVVRRTVALPPWAAAQWPRDLAGLTLGGVNVGARRGVSVACNFSVDALDCAVTFP